MKPGELNSYRSTSWDIKITMVGTDTRYISAYLHTCPPRPWQLRCRRSPPRRSGLVSGTCPGSRAAARGSWWGRRPSPRSWWRRARAACRGSSCRPGYPPRRGTPTSSPGPGWCCPGHNIVSIIGCPIFLWAISSDRASFGYLGDTPDRNLLAAESPLSEPKVPCLVCFISRQRAESGRELDKLENYSTINLDIENSPSMLQYYNSLYTETEGGRDGEVDTQIVLLWRQFFLERKLNSVTVNLIHPLQTLEVRKI